MLSLEKILTDTIWVGKFYEGGRVSGTYHNMTQMRDDFRDFDIACTENQPEHLRDFYRGYFDQSEYYLIEDYYNNVYANRLKMMYEASYIKDGLGHANIYIAQDKLSIRAHFIEKRPGCELVGVRRTTFVKPGQPMIDLTRGGN